MTTEVSLEIRSLMSRFRSGDRMAADALVEDFYPELRRLAAARMQMERREHTWTPTVLVNELYLELVKIKALRAADEDSSERDAFLKLAGHIMRRLLIHHSGRLYRRAQNVDVNDLEVVGREALEHDVEALAQVEDLLERLQKLDPKLRTVVELRAFEGKTADETAELMACSERTVHKYWSFARHWLASEFKHSGDPQSSQQIGSS
jgi:RNA polymerase sigma factor (TIGR02999 family)